MSSEYPPEDAILKKFTPYNHRVVSVSGCLYLKLPSFYKSTNARGFGGCLGAGYLGPFISPDRS